MGNGNDNVTRNRLNNTYLAGMYALNNTEVKNNKIIKSGNAETQGTISYTGDKRTSSIWESFKNLFSGLSLPKLKLPEWLTSLFSGDKKDDVQSIGKHLAELSDEGFLVDVRLPNATSKENVFSLLSEYEVNTPSEQLNIIYKAFEKTLSSEAKKALSEARAELVERKAKQTDIKE